jgi:hypothetical protein
MGNRLACAFAVLLVGCGDDAPQDVDAHDVDAPDVDAHDVDAPGVIDAGSCAMGMADHATFWPTICDAADTCGWLAGGHPELETSEATCNTRHASDPEPSAQLAYLAGFETRVHAAAACLGCQSLLDAYFRPDLEDVFCGHVVRCFGQTDSACRATYRMAAMQDGSQAKFDYACPRYCIEALAVDAACSNVMACLMACN